MLGEKMEKVELITLVNNIELINKLKEFLEKNNIQFEDEMETNEWYSQSGRGLRYIKIVYI